MAGHLPNLSVGVALPQQDVPLQAPASTQAEGLAVGKAVHSSFMRCHRVQHFAPGEVCDLDSAVQGTCDQAQLMDIGHLQGQPQYAQMLKCPVYGSVSCAYFPGIRLRVQQGQAVIKGKHAYMWCPCVPCVTEMDHKLVGQQRQGGVSGKPN